MSVKSVGVFTSCLTMHYFEYLQKTGQEENSKYNRKLIVPEKTE